MRYQDTQKEPRKTHYRTIFLSDIHLGTKGCQADRLIHFLKHHDCDTLYLVGDIIDGWRLRSSFYWPQSHNNVLRRFFTLMKRGTRIVFVTGNHDEFLRKYSDMEVGNLCLVDQAVHETADGRRLLVVARRPVRCHHPLSPLARLPRGHRLQPAAAAEPDPERGACPVWLRLLVAVRMDQAAREAGGQLPRIAYRFTLSEGIVDIREGVCEQRLHPGMDRCVCWPSWVFEHDVEALFGLGWARSRESRRAAPSAPCRSLPIRDAKHGRGRHEGCHGGSRRRFAST